SVFVVWREIPNGGMTANEQIRIARINAGTGAAVWNPAASTVATSPTNLLHPRLGVSRQSGTIAVGFDNNTDSSVAAVSYATGTVTPGPTMFGATTQPQVAVIPTSGPL